MHVDFFGLGTLLYPHHSLTIHGILSVSKEDILKRPKEYYENLIKELSDSSTQKQDIILKEVGRQYFIL